MYPLEVVSMAAPMYSEPPTGAPSPANVPQAPTPPPIPSAPTPEKNPLIRKDMISTRLILIMMIVGMILFYVGLMVLVSTILMKPPQEPDYDEYDSYDEYEEAVKSYEKRMQEYQDSVRNMIGIGDLVIIAGGIVESIGFFGGGVGNSEHDPKIRVALISGGVTVQIVVFIIIYIFNSMYGALLT